MLKDAAASAARRHGWTATTEAAGDGWRADVLAVRNNHQVAVEIQWSSQTHDLTFERQARYRDAGIRGLWLLRQADFPISHDLPAVCIEGSVAEGFVALVPDDEHMRSADRKRASAWHKVIPVQQFFDAVFSNRFQFGLLRGASAELVVETAIEECWHPRCKAQLRIITGINVRLLGEPSPVAYCALDDFSDKRPLIEPALAHLERDPLLGPIKHRFSNTREEAYLSNGCPKCDRLIGSFFAVAGYETRDRDFSFPLLLDRDWTEFIEQHSSYVPHWHVYPQRNGPAGVWP